MHGHSPTHPPGAFSFIISGFESPSHVSEETRNARRAVPRAIFGSVVLTVVGGLCLLLAMMFSVQDPTFSTTISPTGQTWEYATLYFDVFENWFVHPSLVGK